MIRLEMPAAGRSRRSLSLALTAVLVAGGLLVVAPPTRAEPLPNDPIIYVEPDCFPYAVGPNVPPTTTTVTVRGRNFDRNRQIVVSNYERDFNRPATEVTATSNNYGLFSATITVTAQLYYYYNRITAGYDQGQILADFYILSCGTTEISVTPRCVPVGQAASVTVEGTGFDPVGGAIVITVYDWNTGKQHAAMERPAAASFSQTVSLPALPVGEYQVEVRQPSNTGTRSARQWLLAPCPTVTVEPTCVAAGAPPERVSLVISGSGFIRGHGPEGEGSVDIIYDPQGQPQEFYYRLPDFGQLGPGGTFGPVEITPYARPAGAYTIAIVQRDYDRTVASRVTARVTAPCPASPTPTPLFQPTLTVVPDCGPPALLDDEPRLYSISVRGQGYQPLAPVTVVFDADGVAAPQPSQTFQATTLQDGSFVLTITPDYRPPGSYRIAGLQEARIGPIEASADFRVPCAPAEPEFTIDPTCGPAARGQPEAYVITATGSGFVPGRVELIFDALIAPEMTPALADENGAFSAVIVATGRAPGLYLVVARQLAVTGSVAEASVPFVVSCEGAVLRITPTLGPRGLVPVVTGVNFPALVALQLYWNKGIDAGKPLAVVTDENGSFTRSVVIYRSDFIGPRRMTITDPADPEAYVDLYVDYEVMLRSLAPPFVPNPFGDSTMVSR